MSQSYKTYPYKKNYYRLIARSILFPLILASLVACSGVPKQKEKRVPSYTLKNTHQTVLSRGYQAQVKRYRGKSGFVLLGSGLDAFAARTELFRMAEKSIDVQYYLVRDDLTGFLFYESLRKAADRGVRVRILLDDHNLAGQTARLAAFDKHPNIEIRIFNPLSRKAPRFLQYVFKLGKITRRMHNKSVVVDNRVTIVGSRNIGNEYSEADAERVYSGMEVLAVGPIVNDVSRSFDRYWNFRKSIKVSNLSKPAKVNIERAKSKYRDDPMARHFERVLKTSVLVPQIRHNRLPFRWAKSHLIQDQPEKVLQKKRKQGHYLDSTGFAPYIKDSKRDILIITPYFVPGKEGLAFFKRLKQRGLNVSVLTNSYASTDVKIVNAHYNKYRKALVGMGVKLYEFKAVDESVNLLKRAKKFFRHRPVKAGLHGKILSFDKNQLYIGSFNVDPRSIYENTEIGVMIASDDLTLNIVKWFEHNLDQLAYHVELRDNDIVWKDYANKGKEYYVEPNTRKTQRLWMNFMSYLPVEKHL